MPHKRKLIEVSPPLEVINREAAREKSIRHGHPSTVYLWWARRPLAAARAVLFAQLVDDPSNHPDRFHSENDQQRERKSLVIGALGDVELTPWRKVLQPHPDVVSGRFRESGFAANLHSVAHETGTTSQEYTDPVEHFRRPFLTYELKDFLTQAANRIAGRAGSPVINLQTTFGGGKTHSMLVLRHVAAAEGAENVEIMLDVRAENSLGFSESVARTVKENGRVLGFDVSEFEGVEW